MKRYVNSAVYFTLLNVWLFTMIITQHPSNDDAISHKACTGVNIKTK